MRTENAVVVEAREAEVGAVADVAVADVITMTEKTLAEKLIIAVAEVATTMTEITLMVVKIVAEEVVAHTTTMLVMVNISRREVVVPMANISKLEVAEEVVKEDQKLVNKTVSRLSTVTDPELVTMLISPT